MIALTPLQRKIYEAAEAAGRPVTQDELVQSLGWKRDQFRNRLMVCIEKGHVRLDTTGAVIACEPPHIRIMREVCASNGLSQDQIVSSSKTMKLTRARRMIALLLQKANYSVADIAEVVNRHPSGVMDYLFADRAAERSKHRAAQLMQQRASA